MRIRDPDTELQIRIRIATLISRALAEVCAVPVLLVDQFTLFVRFNGGCFPGEP